MTIKSLPISAWICIWCCVYSRIEDLVRREWCWKGSKEEGDSARPRSLPGSLYASECECQRVGQPARQLDQRRRLSSACAPPSSPVLPATDLPAGTFPWSSGGFHIACSKNNNNQQSISSVQLKFSYVWWNLYQSASFALVVDSAVLWNSSFRCKFDNSVLFCYSTNIILC